MNWRIVPVTALLLIAALLLAGAYTAPGARALLSCVTKLTNIEVEYADGSLASTLRLKGLHIQRKQFSVDVSQLTIQPDMRCLWRGALCVQHLHIGSLVMSVQNGAETDDDADVVPAQSPVSLPFPVEVRAMHVDSIHIDWPGGEWSQKQSRLALQLYGRQLIVAQTRIGSATLTLRDNEAAATAGSAFSPPPINFPLLLKIDDLALEESEIVLGKNTYSAQDLSLTAEWDKYDLSIDKLSANLKDRGQLTLESASLQFRESWPLQAEIYFLPSDALVLPQLANRDLRLSANGTLDALALRLDVPGDPQLQVNAQANLIGAQPTFSAQLNMEAVSPVALGDYVELPDRLQDLMINTPLQMTIDGNLAEHDVAIAGSIHTGATGTVLVNSAVRVSPGQLEGDASLRAAGEAGEADSTLSLTGDLSWRDGVSWDMAAASPGITLPTALVAQGGYLEGKLSTRGTLQGDTPRVFIENISLTGAVGESPVRIEGIIAILDNTIGPETDFQASASDTVLKAQTEAEGSGQTVLSLTIGDLGQWLPDASGVINLNARLKKERQISLQGDVEGLGWGELLATSGELTASFDPRDRRFNLDLGLIDLYSPLGKTDSLKLTLDGGDERLRAKLTSSGAISGELLLSGQRYVQGWSAELAPTSIDIAGLNWQLEKPVRLLQSAPDIFEMTAHCWQHEHAALCLDRWTSAHGNQNTANLSADALLFERLLPADMALTGPVELDFDFSPGAGRDTTALHVTGVAGPLALTIVLPEGEVRQSRWQRIDLDIGYRGGALDLQADISNANRTELAMMLRLPPRSDQPLKGQLRFDDLDLARLADLSGALSSLEGSVDGELLLRGTAARPLIDGELLVDIDQFSIAGNPSELNDLQVSIQARGDRADLTGRGRLGGGDFTLQGNLLTAPQKQLSLSFAGDRNTLFYPPSTQFVASSDLTLTATSESFDLSGDITVHEGFFEYEQLPDYGVGLSNDVVMIDANGQVLEDEEPIVPSSIDVKVRIEDDFVLSGPQLRTNLFGELQVRRRLRQPLELFGSLSTSGGYAVAFERTLQIKRGVINFTGAPDNPSVDLRAERYFSADDVTAGVYLHGSLATDLSLDIYSEPSMTQGEAMSWLIWGRGLNSDPDGDGAILALSLAGSVVNQSSLVEAINEVPGIDNISFGAEGQEGDATATVSGYIGERLYLSYGVGLYEPINVLTARLFLRSRLWLEVVSRLENSFDLYYSFDIR